MPRIRRTSLLGAEMINPSAHAAVRRQWAAASGRGEVCAGAFFPASTAGAVKPDSAKIGSKKPKSGYGQGQEQAALATINWKAFMRNDKPQAIPRDFNPNAPSLRHPAGSRVDTSECAAQGAAPGEHSLMVLLHVVERPQQLAWCLDHLRRVYPSVPVMAISDGVPPDRYRPVCRHYDVELIGGSRLKLASEGGAWWQRALEVADSAATEFVIKIDPDTLVQRTIAFWPVEDLAGTVSGRGTRWEHVQGGAQLLSRRLIAAALASGIFTGAEYRNPATYAWSEGLLRAARRSGYLCTDAMLMHAVRKLSLAWGNWSEVASGWKKPPRGHKCSALSHPHKWRRFAMPTSFCGEIAAG